MSSSSATPARRRGAPRLNQYELDIEIGRGGFGKVHLGTDIKTGRKVAIKIVNKETLRSTDTESYFLREAAMSQQLDHPNVVKALELIDHHKVYALVMELAPGGELFDKIIERKRFDEKTARKYFQELCSAVAFLHANGIVHRDLKAENMLVGEKGELKICDLGLARYTQAKLNPGACTIGKTASQNDEEILFMSLAGSPDYVAPEVLQPKGYRGGSCDYWSMGVILYFMMCGYLPFYSMAKDDRTKQTETRQRIMTGEFNANSRYLTPQVADLIKKMLTVDPAQRATIAEIANHPWTQTEMSEAIRERINESLRDKGESHQENEARKTNLSGQPTKTAATSLDNLTDPDIYKLVSKAFRSCNVGQSGKLTRDEVRDVLIKLNKGNPVQESEVNQFLACFKGVDNSNNSNKNNDKNDNNESSCEVSEEEFTAGWSKLGPYLHSKGIPIERLADMFSFDLESKLVAELRLIFQDLDIDNSGVISIENLMGIEQLNLNKEQAQQLLDTVDVDKTKTITFENFVTAVTRSDSLQRHPLVARLQRLDKMFRVLEKGTQSSVTISSGFTVAGFREQIIEKLFNESESIHTTFQKPEGVTIITNNNNVSNNSGILSPTASPQKSPAKEGNDLLASPLSPSSQNNSSFNNSPADADQMLRMNSSFNAPVSYVIPENLNYLSGEVKRADGAAHLMVGVKLQPSVPGFTRLVVYRIHGKTLVFHEWFREFRALLHKEIVQVMEDTAIVGEAELM